MSSLSVYSVFWGDKYDKAYVYALQAAVKKHLSVDHTFKCITSQNLPGIKTVLPPVSYTGWWQKLGLFSPRVTNGPSLYFDLDVVITGSLDYLVPYTEHELCAPANWAQSGHGGIQSSVMAWNGKLRTPLDTFKWGVDNERLWGDQEYLTELRGDDWVKLPKIGSYKYHCRQNLPKDLSVVCFHGKPDPDEISDKWMLPYTQTLHSHIKESTPSGYDRASLAIV